MYILKKREKTKNRRETKKQKRTEEKRKKPKKGKIAPPSWRAVRRPLHARHMSSRVGETGCPLAFSAPLSPFSTQVEPWASAEVC